MKLLSKFTAAIAAATLSIGISHAALIEVSFSGIEQNNSGNFALTTGAVFNGVFVIDTALQDPFSDADAVRIEQPWVSFVLETSGGTISFDRADRTIPVLEAFDRIDTFENFGGDQFLIGTNTNTTPFDPADPLRNPTVIGNGVSGLFGGFNAVGLNLRLESTDQDDLYDDARDLFFASTLSGDASLDLMVNGLVSIIYFNDVIDREAVLNFSQISVRLADGMNTPDMDVSEVPVPPAIALFATGLAAFGAAKRKKKLA